MDEQSLLNNYPCLKPCSYMEYQVLMQTVLNFKRLNTQQTIFFSWLVSLS